MTTKVVHVRNEKRSLVLVLGGVKEMKFYGIEDGDWYFMSVEERDSEGRARVIRLVRGGKVRRR